MKVPADLVLAEVSCALQVAAFSLCAYVSEGALNSHMGLKAATPTAPIQREAWLHIPLLCLVSSTVLNLQRGKM